jgi:flagellar hook-length control protein FliK
MNVNILTIDSNLAALAEASPSPSKPDSDSTNARFAPALDHEKAQAKTPEKPATDNTKEKDHLTQRPADNSPEESAESVNKKAKPDKDADRRRESELPLPPGKTDTGATPCGHASTSGKSEQAHAIAPALAQIIDVPAKPGRKFAQINTNTQNKSPSVTGHAAKSTQIKLLHVTEKGQLGIKTILPSNSNGQNGLKVTTPEAKSIPAVKKQPETASNSNKAAVSARNTSLTEKVDTEKTTPETLVDSGKSSGARDVKPSVINVNLTAVPGKSTETRPRSDQSKPEKLEPTAGTDVKSRESQDISNLSNPNSKQSIPAGNVASQSKNFQELDGASVQVAAGPARDQSNSASNKSPSQGFEQMLSHSNSQTLVTEQMSGPAKNSAAANTQHSSQNNASADIGRQILESVQSSMSRQSAEHQITVRLNPPELGKVLIRFQQQENELTGLMEVNKAQTRFEIEQALPQIIRNLADCGIHIRRLEVTLSNDQQPGQGAFGNQSLQNGTAQQQYSANQGPSGNDSALSQSNEWLSGNYSYENLSELQETLITNGSINLLI